MGMTETKPLRGFLTQNGCEVVSNDGLIKICLSKRMVLPQDGIKQVGYYSLFFVQEDRHVWRMSSNAGDFYPTIKDFIIALRGSDEFSEAVRDLYNEMKENDNEK